MGGWRGVTRDMAGWGLTGWVDRAGRTLSPRGRALVKPDGSVAPMLVFCRMSVGKKWGGRPPVPQPCPQPHSQPWPFLVSLHWGQPVPLRLGVHKDE